MILVTGATGNIGRAVVKLLSASGTEFHALTRDPSRAPAGVEAVQGDLTDPTTLPAALAGHDAMFLLLPPRTDPGPIVVAARDAGVRYLTMVGSLTAQTNPESPVGRGTLRGEQVLRESGLRWTVLRAWEFASNTLGWAPSIRDRGVVDVLTVGEPSPVIDPADIGSAAATVLTEMDGGDHDAQIYSLTGPENLTVEDKVRAIGTALGRELKLENKNDEQAAAQAMWLPGVCTVPGPGVLSTVEDLTGAPARTFQQWADDHVAAFR